MKRKGFPSNNYTKSPRQDQVRQLPPYKIVKGTNFAVDAFNYGHIPGVEVYFLSHFHSDHYTGLTSKFDKPIYCTKITGEFCVKRLRVKSSLINVIEVDKRTEIHGIKVAAIDANHCPGSVMLIFTLKNGQNILHCGDFRANFRMEMNPFLKNINIDILYLDTTYCDPKYDFPPQSKSIKMALSILAKKKQAMLKNKDDFSKLLIVCGTYVIGKENFFLGIAEKLGIQIWCDSNKKLILKTAINRVFNDPPMKCQLHVLSMKDINSSYLETYLNSFNGRFSECIGFKPSGWENSKESFSQTGNVTIFGIPYSEHSSFTEMKHFSIFCKPNSIISTIPGHAKNKAVQGYISSWTGKESKIRQTKIHDFFTVTKIETHVEF